MEYKQWGTFNPNKTSSQTYTLTLPISNKNSDYIFVRLPNKFVSDVEINSQNLHLIYNFGYTEKTNNNVTLWTEPNITVGSYVWFSLDTL